MADKTQDKSQRYEKLVKAVAGGELAMVKYLWEMLERFESIVDETPQAKIVRMKREVDEVLQNLKKNPPKDGVDGKRGRPGGPGKDGQDGRDGRDGRDGDDGEDGRDGRDGKDGKNGRMPDHEWDGTKIRFELPDGEWGEWVDLRGKMGPAGESYGPAERGGGFGPQEQVIKAGSNVTVTKDASGAYVIASTASGSGVTVETPAGDVNAVNDTYTPSAEPKWVVADGVTYFDGAGYTWGGTDIVMDLPPSNFIRAIV